MNALLAGEVPGLWPADDLSRLLTNVVREEVGSRYDADDDAVVLKWFHVRRNLHVVFCLEDLDCQRQPLSIFNRCVDCLFGLRQHWLMWVTLYSQMSTWNS